MAQPTNAQPVAHSHPYDDTPATNETTTRRSLAFSANAVLRSIISGPVDSVDDQEEHENGSNVSNNGRRRRCVSPVYICVPITLLALFFIFAGTLVGAIVSWHQYEKLRLHDAWFVRSCIIIKVRVTKSPDANKWRPEADVRGFGLKNASEVVTAYWGRSRGYYATEETARRLTKRLPRAGLGLTCWVKHNMPRTVSMVKVTRATLSQEDLYLNMAWGSSFFAAVSGFLLLTLTVNFVQRAIMYAVTGGERATAAHDVIEGNTPTKRTACLSPAQTRWVVSEFGYVVEGNMMPEEWVCSICLEECEETQRLRVIVLPCNHRFHSRCLKKWLRRGSPTCPLCNFEVHSLFDEDGTPIDNQGNAIMSPTATETQIEAVMLDMRMDNGEERSLITPPPPSVPTELAATNDE